MLWGAVCDARLKLTGEGEWAERALTCYMQAAVHKLDRAPGAIPRVLALLRDAKGEVRAKLTAAFGKHCDGVPLWGWLPWLPQLLQALAWAEGPQVQHLLLRCVKVYPQAVYYPLRTYCADCKLTSPPPPLWSPPQPPAPSTTTAPADPANASQSAAGAPVANLGSDIPLNRSDSASAESPLISQQQSEGLGVEPSGSTAGTKSESVKRDGDEELQVQRAVEKTTEAEEQMADDEVRLAVRILVA